jgi:antitoxin HigA-1
MKTKKMAPIHPGEVLLEEFLRPMNITQYRLAKDIHVPARRINEIVHGDRSVSADTALRLARYFGSSAQFWLNLQAGYDLATEQDRVGSKINREVRQRAVA